MRVLFDLTSADRRDGVSRWSRGVLSALPTVAPDWDIAAAFAGEPHSVPDGIESHVATNPRRGRYLSMFGWDRRVRALGAGRFDAVVGPAFVAWKTDGAEIPVVHDLAFLRFPETVSRRNLAYLKRMVPRSVARAGAVVTVSDAVAAELATSIG